MQEKSPIERSDVGKRRYSLLFTSLSLIAAIGVLVLGFILVYQNNSSKTCTTYNGNIQKQCVEDYVGLTQDEAIDKAKTAGFYPQISSVDGVAQGVIDIGGYTIYFKINEGIVVSASFGDR